MSRRARKYAQARPWETYTPDDDERTELDRLLGTLPGDDQQADAFAQREHEHARQMSRGSID